jgi:phosphoketolase
MKSEKPISGDLLRRIDAYWRAANYVSAGQLYLRENPLLREQLELKHVKLMLLGHWGTTPDQNFIYVHLNRIIKQYDLNMFYDNGREPDVVMVCCGDVIDKPVVFAFHGYPWLIHAGDPKLEMAGIIQIEFS